MNQDSWLGCDTLQNQNLLSENFFLIVETDFSVVRHTVAFHWCPAGGRLRPPCVDEFLSPQLGGSAGLRWIRSGSFLQPVQCYPERRTQPLCKSSCPGLRLAASGLPAPDCPCEQVMLTGQSFSSSVLSCFNQ